MGQQHRTTVKRRRRQRYLKRQKALNASVATSKPVSDKKDAPAVKKGAGKKAPAKKPAAKKSAEKKTVAPKSAPAKAVESTTEE